MQLLLKFKDKKLSKFKNFINFNILLKTLTQINNDRIQQVKENPQIQDLDLPSFIYNNFLNQFGIKQIADQKFLILIFSIRKHQNKIRINQFSRFCQLQQEKYNYTTGEYNKYLEAFDYVQNTNIGTIQMGAVNEPEFYVPFARLWKFLDVKKAQFDPKDYVELQKQLQNLKENDPKNVNPGGMVNFDLFMIKALEIYTKQINKAKLYVKNAFNACDLDGNKMCNL